VPGTCVAVLRDERSKRQDERCGMPPPRNQKELVDVEPTAQPP
jgi:hypothetical protein